MGNFSGRKCSETLMFTGFKACLGMGEVYPMERVISGESKAFDSSCLNAGRE